MTRILTLAPPAERGASSEIALGNAQHIVEWLQRELAEPADLVVLPLGCLSGGAGFPSREVAGAALAMLQEVARGSQCALAGADHFGGIACGPMGQDEWRTCGQGQSDRRWPRWDLHLD